jgi:hypothetical protein
MVQDNYSGGNATVLTPFLSGITNTVAKQQQRIANQEAQEAKRLQQEQAELSDIVKKVNTTGVQQQDIPEVSERLDKVYETYYRANQAKTPQERLTLKMDLERELNDMSQLVNQSKQRGVAQVKLADFIGNPTNMGLVSQDAINRFKQNANLPTSKLSPTAFSRDEYVSPDTSYLDKVIDSSAKGLLANATELRKSGKSVNISGKNGTEQFTEKVVPKDTFAKDLYRQYNFDNKFKNLVDFTSSQNGLSKDEYLLTVVDEYDKANKLKNTKQVETVFARAPRQSNNGSSDNEGFVIEDNFDINYGSKSTGKTATVTAREYVSIPTSPTVSAGKFNMQDTDGNQYNSNDTTEELKLVSVGTFPVLKTDRKVGNDVVKAGSMATKSYSQKDPNNIEYVPKAVVNIKNKRGNTTTYFADPKEVIARTKLTKAQKTALDAYTTKARSRSTQPTKATTTKKTETKGELD